MGTADRFQGRIGLIRAGGRSSLDQMRALRPQRAEAEWVFDLEQSGQMWEARDHDCGFELKRSRKVFSQHK